MDTRPNGAAGALGYPVSDVQEYSLGLQLDPQGWLIEDSSYYVKFQHGYISYYTHWAASDVVSSPPNIVKKIYVTQCNDPFPPEFYFNDPSVQGQSPWSLRLIIGPQVLIPEELQVTEAKWMVEPMWNDKLDFKSMEGLDVTVYMPNPGPNMQVVYVFISFQYTANGQFSQDIVSVPSDPLNPTQIRWTGENLKAGWVVSYENGNMIAQFQSVETASD